ALSQAQLTYETVEQNLRVFQGTLVTTMGLPVTTKFTIGTLPSEVPMQEVSTAVESLITQAETERPDFAASRALVQQAEARVREVRSQALPTLGLTANFNRTTFRGVSNGTASPYSVGLAMRFALFTGWRTQFD